MSLIKIVTQNFTEDQLIFYCFELIFSVISLIYSDLLITETIS